MNKDEQILKCRDDRSPVYLVSAGDSAPAGEPYKLAKACECSWLEAGTTVGPAKLRARIEPWLTSLFQSEHLALLVGSGLSHAVYRIATGNGLPGMSSVAFEHFGKAIEAAAKESSDAAGRAEGNLEDRIRAASELLRGLQILAKSDTKAEARAKDLEAELIRVLDDFARSILQGERGVVMAESGKRVEAFNYLVSFLMSFASRTGTRDRLQMFTTNYDRFIEAGADAAGLHLLDRFIGSLAPVFRSSRLDIDMHYNPPGIRGEPRYLEGVAKFTKLHGSVDWAQCQSTIRRMGLPLGASDIAPYLACPEIEDVPSMRLMVYPNSAKDRETADYPYVDLFRDFAAAACRPNNTLVTYGYSFGDEHINRVIEDMLTIPSTHLVVISYGDPMDRITTMYDRLGRHAQTTILLGDHLGDFRALVDNYLPKPAIDRTTFRMAELLRARLSVSQTDSARKPQDSEGDEP